MPVTYTYQSAWDTIKSYAAKLISIVLLVNGLKEIIDSAYRIYKYSGELQVGPGIAEGQFEILFHFFFFSSLTALIDTAYGLTLFLKPSHKVKVMHLIVGIALFALPFFIPQNAIDQIQDTIFPQSLAPSYVALAQETSPDQALSDFRFQFQRYRDAHKDYLSAKNAYLSFQTLNSRTEAVDKTKILLIQRAETLRSYLFVLRTTLLETEGISQADKSNFADDLQQKESSLLSYHDTIPPITDLEELNEASQSLESQHPELQVLSYQVLYAILKGEQVHITTILTTQKDNIQELIDSVNPNELKITQINQWLKDTQSTLDDNAINYLESEELLEKIRPIRVTNLTNQRNFIKVLNQLEQSRQRLYTTMDFLSETIDLIKYD